MLSTRDPLQIQGHIQMKQKGQKEEFHGNGNQKKAGVSILISEKIDFKIKTVTREKEGDFPGGAVVKNLPANAGDTGSSPGLGRSHMLQSN